MAGRDLPTGSESAQPEEGPLRPSSSLMQGDAQLDALERARETAGCKS